MCRAIFFAAALFLACTAVPAAGLAWNMAGSWAAGRLGARLEATVQQNGNAISGVAYVYSRGKKDTYHFNGNIMGNSVTAGHSDGHVFSGRILNEGYVKGVLKTKGGYRIPVDVHRQ